MGDILLFVDNLSVSYKKSLGAKNKSSGNKEIIRDLSFEIKKGEIFGLIGESGCGKTTTARAISSLIPYDGNIILNNKNIRGLSIKQRSKELQLIFQNPYNSLNPKMKVKDILEEPLRIHRAGKKSERINKVKEIMEIIGLNCDYMDRYIDEMSGGQRQRVAIGSALMLNPELIIADEVLSALDVSVQANIINLFVDINKRLGVSFLFIYHDINVVAYLCDRIAVMYRGEIVEIGDSIEIFNNPIHPYTKLLLKTVVGIEKKISDIEMTKDNENYKSGCVYSKLCSEYSTENCDKKMKLINVKDNHMVCCNNMS